MRDFQLQRFRRVETQGISMMKVIMQYQSETRHPQFFVCIDYFLTFQTRRTYCASNYDDLTEVIEHVKKLHPHVPLGATGISMGG